MGLDMYIYKTSHDKVELDENLLIIKDNSKELEDFFYWRKHPAIHDWMNNLYYDRGGKDTFNGINLYLDKNDLKKLKKDLIKKNLNYEASGFFFGSSPNPNSQEFIRQLKIDLQFIFKALKEIKNDENIVFIYTSSW